MYFFFFILLFVISVPALILFGFSVFYFVLGIKSVIIGMMEGNTVKKTGGLNSIFFSLLGMVAAYFLWHWLCALFLDWEL